MKRLDWCRDEVLRSRRGDGVGFVLPYSRLAVAGSLTFVAVVLLLGGAALVPVEGGTFLEGTVLAAEGAGGRIVVAATRACGLTLPTGTIVELREKAPFGDWHEWTMGSVDGCPESSRLALDGGEEPPPSPGTEVLIRRPLPPRPAYVVVFGALRGEDPS